MMSRTNLMFLTLTLTAQSLQSCASSPSANSLASEKKQSVEPKEAPIDFVSECPWGPINMHGWRSDGISKMFAAAEKTTHFEGRVSKVLNGNTDTHMPHMILLVTKKNSAPKEVVVHVGPAWYLQQQGLLIKVNDLVEIKGQALNSDENTVIATSIKKQNKNLVLRDRVGRPAWARGPHASP